MRRPAQAMHAPGAVEIDGLRTVYVFSVPARPWPGNASETPEVPRRGFRDPRLPRSMALLKMALGCLCAVKQVSLGSDGEDTTATGRRESLPIFVRPLA